MVSGQQNCYRTLQKCFKETQPAFGKTPPFQVAKHARIVLAVLSRYASERCPFSTSVTANRTKSPQISNDTTHLHGTQRYVCDLNNALQSINYLSVWRNTLTCQQTFAWIVLQWTETKPGHHFLFDSWNSLAYAENRQVKKLVLHNFVLLKAMILSKNLPCLSGVYLRPSFSLSRNNFLTAKLFSKS